MNEIIILFRKLNENYTLQELIEDRHYYNVQDYLSLLFNAKENKEDENVLKTRWMDLKITD